jgi:hypothetical protein
VPPTMDVEKDENGYPVVSRNWDEDED